VYPHKKRHSQTAQSAVADPQSKYVHLHPKVSDTHFASDARIRNLEKTIQELRGQLANSQQTYQEKDNLVLSLRAQEESLGMLPATPTHIASIYVY